MFLWPKCGIRVLALINSFKSGAVRTLSLDENPECGPPDPESNLHQSDPRGVLFISHTTFLPEFWIKMVLYTFNAESSSSAQMLHVSATWQFLMFWVILSPLKNHSILIYAGRSGVITEHAAFCINRPSCASSPPWLVASLKKKICANRELREVLLKIMLHKPKHLKK